MTSALELELPMLDVTSPTFQQDAPALFARLHADRHWLARTPLGFAVLDAEAVSDLASEPRLRTIGRWLLEAQGVTSGRLHETIDDAILFRDGDDHLRLRRLVARAFTPRSAESLRPLMRTHLIDLLDRIDGPACEFMSTVADEYSVAVICDVVGAPQQDRAKFSAWAMAIFKQFGLTVAQDIGEIEAAVTEMEHYTVQLIKERRARPADDLLNAMLVARDENDRLTDAELVMLVGAILLGGTDTTRNQLGLAITCFADHPDQWAALAEEPQLAEQAVDEVLRYAPTAQGLPRVVRENLVYRGVMLPEGSFVTLSTWAANLQPDSVTDPAVFDIRADRRPWRPHTFGNGPHFCLGAHLARAELVEAFQLLPSRMPDLTLDGEVIMQPSFGLQGPVSLPIRFGSSA